MLLSTWGTRKKASILQANSNSLGESASRKREIILKNSGTISALGHFQSTGGENFSSSLVLLVKRTCGHTYHHEDAANLPVFIYTEC